MFGNKSFPSVNVLFIVILLALVATLVLPALPAAAQGAFSGPIEPVGGSNVRGDVLVAADPQGWAVVTVRLGGLPARSSVNVSVHGGTCSQPSTGLFPLFSFTANDAGQATAYGPVVTAQGTPLRLQELIEANYILLVFANEQTVACGVVPRSGTPSDLNAALLAEAERQQVMQFNPNAALQKRIFADGFVPNSAEFSATLEATTFAVQRAEHLRTGVVRAYFVRVGDWANVRYAQRGLSQDAFGLFMLQEAEQRQAIRFNPNAALQKRIFADGFVPNSPEFALAFACANYTAQRAEHLGTGRVRAYYAVTGNWGDVRFAQRGAPNPPTPQPPPTQPTIAFTPLSGPSGTVVRVTGTGFTPFAGIALWGAPINSQGIQMATGITDAAGRVAFEVPVQGSPGMRWVFNLIAGNQRAQSGEYTITQ